MIRVSISPLQGKANPLDANSETAKKLIQSLESEFKGFTGLAIRSEEYAEKVVELDSLVIALAQLHPRWDAQEGVIHSFSDEDRETYEENPLFPVFELTEDLLWAWNKMQAAGPTIESLVFFQRFSAPLYALGGKVEQL